MEERDLLSTSIRSGANFNVIQGFDVYPQYYWIEDRVASVKHFCTASTKRLLARCLFHKYQSKA